MSETHEDYENLNIHYFPVDRGWVTTQVAKDIDEIITDRLHFALYDVNNKEKCWIKCAFRGNEHTKKGDFSDNYSICLQTPIGQTYWYNIDARNLVVNRGMIRLGNSVANIIRYVEEEE